MVAIQPHSTRPPFFCVHPADGLVFCYLPLAKSLGQEQPFYGLQTPSEGPGDSIEELATIYLTAVQTVQPHGPYFLGGWSLGGMIALEMAQQLQRQGEKTDVLAIFDSIPSHPQRRAHALEAGVDLGDTGIAKEFLADYATSLPKNFEQWESEEQIKYLMEHAKKKKDIPFDTSIDVVRRYIRIRIANEYLSSQYLPYAYEQKINYFGAEDSIKQGEMKEEEDSEHKSVLQRWHELAKGGLAVYRVPGTHHTLIEEPNVQILANALKRCIDHAYDPIAR